MLPGRRWTGQGSAARSRGLICRQADVEFLEEFANSPPGCAPGGLKPFAAETGTTVRILKEIQGPTDDQT